MSRAGRGGRGGGRRGGFGGPSNPLPMGLTFADIQSMPREATALYPSRRLPVFTQPSDEEKTIAQLQIGFANRLKKSPYYIVEKAKSTELPRYSDKYRPSAASHPTLKRSMLHAPFFPTEIYEDYFNPRRKRKCGPKSYCLMCTSDSRETIAVKKASKHRVNLDEVAKEDEEEKSGEDKQSDAGSEEAQSDYDVEEEYDNDYAENYFDNGEGDDLDNLGDGGMGDDGGGAGHDYE